MYRGYSVVGSPGFEEALTAFYCLMCSGFGYPLEVCESCSESEVLIQWSDRDQFPPGRTESFEF